MKEHQYNPDLPHGLPFPSYMKISEYGIASLWTEEMGQFEDLRVPPYGSLNQDGLGLLKRARDKGWDHHGFFYYKKLGINWFTKESIDSLIDFTEIQPLKEGENFAQKEITSPYVKPYKQSEDIYQPIDRHSTRLLGSSKNYSLIKSPWDTSTHIDYDHSLFGWDSGSYLFPTHIPALLTSKAVSDLMFGGGFWNLGVTKYEDSMEVLQTLNRSELQQALTDEFFTEEITSVFTDMLAERGLFIGAWAARYFNRKIARKMPDLRLRIGNLENLFNEAYGYQEVSKTDVETFHKITGHIFWQMILFSIQNERVRKQVRDWERVHSEPKECALCQKSFSPILTEPGYYFGTNGNTLMCFGCIKPSSPDISELDPLIAKFVETCGFPPQDGVTPIDWRVNIKIPYEQQLNVVKAWSDMGGIHHIKNSLKISWFKAMYDAGCLPEGTVQTGRGIKCVASDGHECGSLDEKTIDDFLSSHNISHDKEPYYPSHRVLNPNKKRRADWQIEDVFVEYFGLAGNAAYDQRTSEKLQLAAECDLELIALFPEDVVDLDNALLKNLL